MTEYVCGACWLEQHDDCHGYTQETLRASTGQSHRIERICICECPQADAVRRQL